MINFLENILQFLKEHKDLLNKNDFDTLYKEANKTIDSKYIPTTEMTSIFLEAGLNPLQYMSSIPDNYLRGNENVTSIEIPNNITLIGKQAFYICDRLTSIVIPNSITYIAPYAFELCHRLVDVVIIGNSATKIDNRAFAACEKLINVTMQNNIATLGQDVFAHCESLANIRFNGTKKEWEDIAKDPLWKRYSSIKIIECKDGTIKLK